MEQMQISDLFRSQQDLRSSRLKEAAIELEAAFFSEMLKTAGYGDVSNSFGGGVGEDQFASFLRDAQSVEMARNGGLGLAEIFFDALRTR